MVRTLSKQEIIQGYKQLLGNSAKNIKKEVKNIMNKVDLDIDLVKSIIMSSELPLWIALNCFEGETRKGFRVLDADASGLKRLEISWGKAGTSMKKSGKGLPEKQTQMGTGSLTSVNSLK